MIVAGSPYNSSPISSTNRVLFPVSSIGNLRILYNNLADTATTAASSTNGSLVIGNVKTEYRTEIHRSVGTSVTYTLSWPTDKTIGCVALPCTNLSSTAIIRIKLYNSASVLREDTGDLYATYNYSNEKVLNVNTFSSGGISKSITWFTHKPNYVRSMTIELVDASNAAGYIDNSRILVGDYWEPTYNLEKGIQFHTVDTSTTSETNAGSLVTDLGFIRDKLSFDFALLPEADRVALLNIIRIVGTNKNFLLSIFPGSYNSYEQDYTIYGKRTSSPLVNLLHGFYKHSLEITSW